MRKLALMTCLGTLGLSAAIVGATVALAPAEASACGGTFCDSGPTAMPVDQTGENILFVMQGDWVEAHIQIQYDPDTEASQFAWVVPVQEIPEFKVGSQALFDNILAATVPSYGSIQQFEGCGDEGSASGAGSSGSDGGGDGGTGGDTGGGPDVVFQDTVGAFDVVVLSGGTSDEVMQWLGDNGYQQDPNAEPILDEYLQDGFLFAAFKLTNGADVAEIHPITLKFPATQEACVPLRLTRIAAQDDMEVRTFFLSDQRVVPRTYRHVQVNPVKLDWSLNGGNYKELITLAVDAEMADGKAFVTEYAGPSAVVPQFGLYDTAWQSGPFLTIEARDVIDTLMAQNILYCDTGYCEFYHSLIEGVLAQFLPVPAGLTRDDFYSCLSCYEGMIDMMAWDATEFATAYQERIIDPGAYAEQMLATWPYLTRMYTTISPGEMTEDPFFYENPDLADVTNMQQFATQRILCDGDSVWVLPDGREVYVLAGAPWPEFPGEMPWEEDVERMLPTGAPENLVDNSALIDIELAKHNCQYDWPSANACGNGGGSDSDSGPTTTYGSDSDTDSDSAGMDTTATRGCSCTAAHGNLGGAIMMLASLLGLGFIRRQRPHPS